MFLLPSCRRRQFAAFSLLAAVSLIAAGCDNRDFSPESPTTTAAGSAAQRDFLFCFWNVENFFDDQDDHRTAAGDKEYDGLYANRPDLLQLKLAKLTEALLKMNGGKGPDIVALSEVESVRAAELLRHALNAKLPDSSLHYQAPLMKEVSVGRHIAPAILTRLPVARDRTRNHGNRYRIIEGHVLIDGRELIVMASHWTSRLKEGNDKGRAEYADRLYGAANAIYHNGRAADLLICGDFNDTPQDVAVARHLHSSADGGAVRAAGEHLQLLNLMGDKDPGAGFGTHYHNRWLIFDQILVSPGMLDNIGWSCDPASVQTINSLSKPGDRNRRPWRFGGEKETGARGYSDHFPVTARLTLNR
jgi:endonuclease/exonuclease/phosphatase family metal-dependent hydrolase